MGKPVVGLMQNQPEWNAPDAWSIYFHTADIQKTAQAITPAGGSRCVQPMEVKEKGWMAMGTDPSGAAFGLWQPTGHRGFEVLGEAGAPVWHQLTTREFANAVDFYRAVLGWETRVESDTDEFRYEHSGFRWR